ncbi:MAG: hypothetical protein HQK53_11045 [Oligoflexia bacterium]|nr:hypothetical protein [Oligoflexia bacterium]
MKCNGFFSFLVLVSLMTSTFASTKSTEFTESTEVFNGLETGLRNTVKINSCVLTNKESPFFQGVLKTGLVAIGGETTGYAIETQQGYYELILPEELKGRIDHLNGLYVEVQGKVVELQGTETGKRKAIKVEFFSVLE